LPRLPSRRKATLRIRVVLEPLKGNEITFPLHYNHLLQSFIYHHISPELADFLHKEGYLLGKRIFKLFCFSRLLGKYRIKSPEEKIIFSGSVSFYLGSPLEKFIQQFAETLLKSPQVRLSRNALIISSIEVFSKLDIQSNVAKGDVTIRMLSPVTTYSTLFSANGKKKTYYYSPFEKEFSQLIRANILRKYQALYRTSYDEKSNPSHFEISPQRVNQNSEKKIKYTPSSHLYTLIKAWLGTYRLQGDLKLISLAYDTGLGSKNSQGFGMFEILEKVK
jgi:CRISPR-associated endoribonuclease Cas6